MTESSDIPSATPISSSYDPPAATARQWHEALAAVLVKSGRFADGDDLDSTPAMITKKTIDGVPISPLSGTEVAKHLRSTPSGVSAVRGTIENRDRQPGDIASWDLRVAINDSDSAARVARALDGGAGSLMLTVRDGALNQSDVQELLPVVLLDVAPIVLDTDRPLEFGRMLQQAAMTQGVALHRDTNLGADPMGELLLTGRSGLDGQVAEIAQLALEANIRGFVVDATIVHDAGAGEALELGYAAAAAMSLLRKLDHAGIPATEAVRLIEFRLSATDQQFTTIAKFRAARAMWARLCDELAIEGVVAQQHAVTSSRMMTAYDPYTNLLRTTIATFAAGTAGAQAITVLPFDAAIGQSGEFGQRLARNISNLLVNESHLAQVSDPAGGAGAIEALTDSLARAAWEVFREIERGGELDQFVSSGMLGKHVTEAADKRRALVASRRIQITGVNEYPQINESLLVRETQYARFKTESLLIPMRDAQEFEQLRATSADRPVFLAPIGAVSAHTNRSNFAANCFTAGGVRTISGTVGLAIEALADEFGQSGAGAVCLVGSDKGYEQEAPRLIAALRDSGAQHIILAGKPASQIATLVDGYLAAGADILAFLRRTRNVLNGVSK